EPTVSDANVVLGRLPEVLIGGDMRLDKTRAAAVIDPIAERLGISREQAALGIVRIVNSNMVRAIRVVSVERGYDPRRFSLMPFGGAGGLHAAEIAAELGMREMLVPLAPGILCAEGLVVSDLKESFVATCRSPLDGDLARVEAELRRLAGEAARWFEGEHISAVDAVTSLVVDMRYVGQNYELPVEISDSDRLPAPAELKRLFFAAHERSYGHHDPEAPVEIMNLRLTATGRLPSISPPGGEPRPDAAPVATRRIWFDERAAVESAVWRRQDLGPGTRLSGPAVIEQLDATTLVPPGATATVDAALNILIAL
ncbi:MAG: hydantoinase/oxoprolinase family protein, partial [Proteobacteria bacterium]|nr:hydantoinase/oxoprolinase family protein [Pseudomonadota bacterium]